MTLVISDLAAATSAYLHDDVKFRIGDVTGNLNPGEIGSLTLRWTNAAAPTGVRLSNVVLHVTVAPDSVAKLRVPGGAAINPRTEFDVNSPRPAANSLVDELFVFFSSTAVVGAGLDSTLDVGESQELELEFEALARGTAVFSGHLHAELAFADLFPPGRGTAGTRQTTVS